VTSVFEPPQPPTAGPPDGGDVLVEDDTTDGRGRQALPPAARAFFDWVVVVGVALFVAIMVRTFLLAHFVVDGDSMLSTLHTGDRVFVNKLSYRLHEPNRGDVVVLHEFEGARGERDLIKRVIALEGESIEIRDCQVYIDDDPSDLEPAKRLVEPYLDPEVVKPRAWCEFGKEVVPDNAVFVMGDNRPGSSDSRDLGPIPVDDIVGRAFVVFWPKGSWQWL
jgi:signal peptidase I